MQKALPAVGTAGQSTPVHGSDVRSLVKDLPGIVKVTALGGLSPASSAEAVGGGNVDAVSVSAPKQAGDNGAAVNSSAAPLQQGAAGEPWAADEGEFAVMLKHFLVCLAVPMQYYLYIADPHGQE